MHKNSDNFNTCNGSQKNPQAEEILNLLMPCGNKKVTPGIKGLIENFIFCAL